MAEQEEVKNALKNYLESLESGVSVDCFASNCIVDWFGCSVRGPTKIHKFLKLKIRAQQLKHADFNKVDKCEPIEVKPTHMTTKKIAKPNDVKNIKSNSYAKTLKSHAESDAEDEKPSPIVMDTSDNGMDTTTLTTPINTPTTSKAYQNAEKTLCLTPLPLSDVEDEDGRVSSNFMVKRTKYINTTPSKSKRKATIPIVNSDSESEDDDIGAVKYVDEANMLLNYSPLHYLETTGHLLTLNLTGVVIDRTVRLRISYRKNLTDNSIQYALIIYECLQDDGQIKVIPQRNLALEFNQEPQQHQTNNNKNEDVVVLVDTSEKLQQQQLNESIERPTTPIRITTIITTPITTTTTTIATTNLSSINHVDDDMSLVANTALRTPTKVSTDPPATPRRRRRDGHMHLKRSYDLVPSFSTNEDGSRKPAKKCNAARTLRL